MSHRIKNRFIVLVIIAIAAGIGAGLFFYLSASSREAGIGAAVAFSVLLVVYNNLVLQRHIGKFERHMVDVHQFEQGIGGRIRDLESQIVVAQTNRNNNESNENGPHPTGQRDDELPVGQIPKATGILSHISGARNERGNNLVSLAGSDPDEFNHSPDNIIALKSRLKQHMDKPAASNVLKIKPSQLVKALNKGGAELFLQPILELPSRNVRYFEAFIRLRIDDNILTAKQFLPAAKDSGQIASIDLISLELTFKVVRSLQRQNSDYSVFWNIAAQTLGNKKIFSEILEQLRANQPLNRQLICEISHPVFRKLNALQRSNLALIRDLGYELSIDKFNPRLPGNNVVEDIFDRAMFNIVKVPAVELMRIGEKDITSFAEHIVPLAASRNITLIGSEVESDAQTVSLIDADIYLAQGNALMPAKALRKELGGA